MDSFQSDDVLGLQEEQKQHIVSSFVQCFDSAYETYKLMQNTGQKKKLRKVCISFLRTGVLFEEPWFRMDLLDDAGWGNVYECASAWEPGFLSERLRETVAGQCGNDMTAGEKEQLILSTAERIAAGMRSIVAEIVNGLKGNYAGVGFEFGEFMGFQTKL